MSMSYTTNKKRVDLDVATTNLVGDIKNSMAEHFALSEKSAWHKAQMLFSLIESLDFIDRELCGPFDETSDGLEAPKEEFVPHVLFRSIEELLDQEADYHNCSKGSILNQKYFLRTLRGVVEQLFQQSDVTGASSADLYRAICLLRDMSEVHNPEY